MSIDTACIFDVRAARGRYAISEIGDYAYHIADSRVGKAAATLGYSAMLSGCHGGDDVPLAGATAFAGLLTAWAIVPSIIRRGAGRR